MFSYKLLPGFCRSFTTHSILYLYAATTSGLHLFLIALLPPHDGEEAM